MVYTSVSVLSSLDIHLTDIQLLLLTKRATIMPVTYTGVPNDNATQKQALSMHSLTTHFNHVRKVSSHVYVRNIDLAFVSQIFLLGFGTVPTVCYICFSHYYISVQPRRCRSTGCIVYLFLFLFILNLCFPHGELELFYIS
jgi:uncharacterized membrane protein YagU involved in acid resistance